MLKRFKEKIIFFAEDFSMKQQFVKEVLENKMNNLLKNFSELKEQKKANSSK